MKRALCSSKASQQGMILFISLIVLVALALAALAMFRGSLGTTLVATNVASKQASLGLADTGVQLAAVKVQERAMAGMIDNDDDANGYFSAVPAKEPDWADPVVWKCGTDTLCPAASDLCGGDATCIKNTTGYTVQYKVHRMCTLAGTAYNGSKGGVANVCALTITKAPGETGSSLGVGATVFEGKPKLYFRITTRVDGPRNARTVTQTVVALQT